MNSLCKDLLIFASKMKKVFFLLLFLLFLSRCSNPDLVVPEPKNSPRTKGLSSGFSQTKDSGISSSGINKNSNSDNYKNKSGRRSVKKQTNSVFTSNNAVGYRSDSTRIARIQSLRNQDPELDLNEPVSRDYLLSPYVNEKFRSMILLSRESFLKINFDNDILDYTDRFYTNGIRIDLISPAFQQFPLSKLMIPYRKSGINYYGLSIVQNMYTPSTTKIGGILFGDRPYSAYLFLGTFRITNDEASRFRQTSELDIGVIGSYSFGEYIQKSFHNEVPTNTLPLGWEYQIKNDLVLNYNFTCEKGLVQQQNFDFMVKGSGSLGTLYTNATGGILIRTGILNPYFVNLGLQKRDQAREKNLRDFQCILYITSSGKLVGYDATLEGGMFNKTSVYTISPENISRFVYHGSVGISMVYRGFKIDAEQFVLSPEFHHGWWHKWVHLGLTFAL
jgi:lipid A 3-O-deacylase